nr:hypothetical protein P5627_17865 [Bacillus safensis]
METEWIVSLLMIIGIDLILGGDNALIIAMVPVEAYQMTNAIKPFGSAHFWYVLMRITMTGAAVYLLTIPYLQFIGGLFLLYIGYNLLIEQKKESIRIKSSGSLWRAVQTIVIADLFMSLDNVIAVAGAAKGNMLLTAFGTHDFCTDYYLGKQADSCSFNQISVSFIRRKCALCLYRRRNDCA